MVEFSVPESWLVLMFKVRMSAQLIPKVHNSSTSTREGRVLPLVRVQVPRLRVCTCCQVSLFGLGSGLGIWILPFQHLALVGSVAIDYFRYMFKTENFRTAEEVLFLSFQFLTQNENV